MNYLLDSSNAAIASVTFMGSTLAGPKGNVSLDGVPLGLVNGEIVVKVGGSIVPPTISGVKVVGIQEVDSTQGAASPDGITVDPGGLSYAIIPSSDFVGTITPGSGPAIAWTGAMGSFSRDAQPGNTLPGATVTCSAGSFTVIQGRPS